jgi:hypothetical protein
MYRRRHDTQHNDIQPNDNRHEGLISDTQYKDISTVSECRYAECRSAEGHYADCRYAECRYAECRGAL